MLEIFDKPLIVNENDYVSSMLSVVEPYLEKRRKEGYFSSADGKRLHYEAYDKLVSRGSVIILHGFCESAEKFREIAYYFRKAGYSVFVPDLRGHGKSYHEAGKKECVTIESFDLYASDLHRFVEDIVKPSGISKKIYIYSHSLGSTAALLYLMKHNDAVSKAVLSSPMICGNMGMPTAVAGMAAKLVCKAGGKNAGAPGRCVFNENQSFEASDATSKVRFYYYHNKRKKEPLYQTSGPDFQWVKASLEARDKLLNLSNIRSIGADMLIFKPEEDKQLLGEYTDMFAERARVRIKKVNNSKHEIFMSENAVLSWYIEEIFEFFRD